jgi:AcrR family transcriptional regulator
MKAREKILEAAITCFCRDGFHLTTTRKIAKEAGVSNGLINYHFQDTSTIFWAVIDYIYGRMSPAIRAEMAKAEGLFEKLHTAIAANFHYCIEKHPKEYSCILLSYYMAPYDKELGRRHRELYAAPIARLKELLEEHFHTVKKTKRKPKGAEEVAQSIWHEMEGAMLFASVTRTPDHKKWLRAQLQFITDKVNTWLKRA